MIHGDVSVLRSILRAFNEKLNKKYKYHEIASVNEALSSMHSKKQTFAIIKYCLSLKQTKYTYFSHFVYFANNNFFFVHVVGIPIQIFLICSGQP